MMARARSERDARRQRRPLPAALEEGARETVVDSDDNGNGEQASTAERELDRMLREWRAEADATRDWPTRSATASWRSAISHARSAGRRAKPCSPMSRALGEETEKADHDGSKRLDKRRPSRAGARHDARPVSRTSRGAALRDASSRRPLSARVRLNQCVGLNTRLASAYVHASASRLATPGSGDKTALPVEPEAKPVGQPKIVIPFVLPTLNDWPAPK
jgi:hypothetical protein